MYYLTEKSQEKIKFAESQEKFAELGTKCNKLTEAITKYINTCFYDHYRKKEPISCSYDRQDIINSDIEQLTEMLEFKKKYYMILQHVNHHKLDDREYYIKLLDSMTELGA